MIRILSVAAAGCAALMLAACGGPEQDAANARADHVEKLGEQQADAVEDNAEKRADEIREREIGGPAPVPGVAGAVEGF